MKHWTPEWKKRKRRFLTNVLWAPYVGTMTDQRNKLHKDYEEIWKDIPIVLVASINGTVTNVYPFEDRDTSSMDLAIRVAHEGQVNGALFDMYQDGYCYAIGFEQSDVNKIRRAQQFHNQDVFTDVMADRIQTLRELHHAFYFPDEIPVDSDATV